MTFRPFTAAAALGLCCAVALSGCSRDEPDPGPDTKFPTKGATGSASDEDPTVRLDALGKGWKLDQDAEVDEVTLCDTEFLPGGSKQTLTDPKGRTVTLGFTEVSSAVTYLEDIEERFVDCGVYANDTTQFFAFTNASDDIDGRLAGGIAGLVQPADLVTEEYLDGGYGVATGSAGSGNWVITVQVSALPTDNPDDQLLVLYADQIAGNQVAANRGETDPVPPIEDLSYPESNSTDPDFEVPPIGEFVTVEPTWDTEGW